MIKTTSLFIKSFFNQGNERTLLAKKNILYGGLIKGGSILIGLLMVPMTINYVNPSQYGIWLTLSSIIGWFSFFDIGLGNGLRNKLAKSNAIGNTIEARTFISTTYALLILISIILFVIFYVCNDLFDWGKILNTSSLDGIPLNHSIRVLFGCFCFQFVVQTISIVLIAKHEPAKASLITLISSVISILIIFVLTQLTTGSLVTLIYVFGGVPPVVLFLFSIYYYKKKYSVIAPSFKFVNFKYAKSLLGVGMVFFFIQIGVMILYQTDNIIISQLFGPREVTEFNIAYKYFWIVVMIFGIVAAPLWSSFTDAYAKSDLNWIISIHNKMKIFWLLLVILILIMLILSPYIYVLWVGNAVKVSKELSIVISLYAIIYIWHSINVYLLNGIGKIRLQLYLVIISSIINIPLAIFLGKKFGMIGIPLSNIIVLVFMSVFVTIQNNRILNNTAKGIWYK